MKQVSAKLKNRGATAAVLMLALGAAVYLNWSFSREAPSSLVVSEDIAADAAETSAAVSEILTDPLAVETAADAEPAAEELGDKNYGEAQLVSVNRDSGTEFFESARLTRSKARDEALDTLKKSLKDAKLSDAEKDQLTTELSARIRTASVDAVREVLRGAGIDAAVSLQDGVCVITPVDIRDKAAIESLLAVNAGTLPWQFAGDAP